MEKTIDTIRKVMSINEIFKNLTIDDVLNLSYVINKLINENNDSFTSTVIQVKSCKIVEIEIIKWMFSTKNDLYGYFISNLNKRQKERLYINSIEKFCQIFGPGIEKIIFAYDYNVHGWKSSNRFIYDHSMYLNRNFIQKYCPNIRKIEYNPIHPLKQDELLLKYFSIDGIFKYVDINSLFNLLFAFQDLFLMSNGKFRNVLYQHFNNHGYYFNELILNSQIEDDDDRYELSNKKSLFLNCLSFNKIGIILKCIGHHVDIIEIYRHSGFDMSWIPKINLLLNIAGKQCLKLKTFHIGWIMFNQNMLEIPESISEKTRIEVLNDRTDVFTPFCYDIAEELLQDLNRHKYLLSHINLLNQPDIFNYSHFKAIFLLPRLKSFVFHSTYENMNNWRNLNKIQLNFNDKIFNELEYLDFITRENDRNDSFENFMIECTKVFKLLNQRATFKDVNKFCIRNYEFRRINDIHDYYLEPNHVEFNNCSFSDDCFEANVLNSFKFINKVTFSNMEKVDSKIFDNDKFLEVKNLEFFSCDNLTDSVLMDILLKPLRVTVSIAYFKIYYY